MVCEVYLNKKCFFQNSLLSWSPLWPHMPLEDIFPTPFVWQLSPPGTNSLKYLSSPSALSLGSHSLFPAARESADHPQAMWSSPHLPLLEASPSLLIREPLPTLYQSCPPTGAFLSLRKYIQSGFPILQKADELTNTQGSSLCLPP